MTTPAQIDEAFDAIAYQKGAAVLRMIESYVGPEPFKKGVNAYLQAHAYGNATSQDFWTAIAAASGAPVDRIMPTFVNQPGVPLIDVSLSCPASETRVTLGQHRFQLEGPALPAAADVWQVPVCFAPADAKRGSSAPPPMCFVLDAPRHDYTIRDAGCLRWVFANAGARGYYRTAYPPEILAAMAPHIEKSLTAPERLSLVDDEWALVRTGRHGVADFLTLASVFGGESSSGASGRSIQSGGRRTRGSHSFNGSIRRM